MNLSDGSKDILYDELPISGLDGVVVDSEGNIYCALTQYSRIQVYNPEGHFLYGIGINAAGGVFNIHMDEKDNLYVATARLNKVYTYSKKKLISEEVDKERFYEYKKTKKEFKDLNNNRYLTNDFFVIPSVVKMEPNGNKTAVIRMSLISWLMEPKKAWLYGVLGLIGIFYVIGRVCKVNVNGFRKEN